MEEYVELFKKHEQYLSSLSSEDKQTTAIRIIAEHADIDSLTLAKAVEEQHATD